jgi:hypothetical protein
VTLKDAVKKGFEKLLTNKEENIKVLLQIVGRPVTALKGHYWTDRNTSGEIEIN